MLRREQPDKEHHISLVPEPPESSGMVDLEQQIYRAERQMSAEALKDIMWRIWNGN